MVAGRNCILLIVADRVRGEGGCGNPGAGLVVEPDERHHHRAGGARAAGLLNRPLFRFVTTWMVENRASNKGSRRFHNQGEGP